MREWLYIAMAVVAALAWTGCGVPEYPICPTCADSSVVPDAAPSDAPPRHDACVESEVCDGYDDDCDGRADEGAAGVGEACGTDEGECIVGTNECVDGVLVCGDGAVAPAPELCDGKDNDCDGVTDNGNPGGGDQCGGTVGECRLGINQCVAGVIQCVGGVEGIPELCDGKDNDCDGMTDEAIPQGGVCGPLQGDVGECSPGRYECVGGTTQCVGAAYPQLERCDALDRDCDGDPLNGFNLNVDSQNCGACGNVCQATHAIAQCDGTGQCEIALCTSNYWDVDGSYANGCEYGPCTYQGAQEACNQSDDDCDGVIDEDLAPPSICDPDGACAGTVATCTTSGWVCNYGPDVQKDPNGVIIPETLCDDRDNDCDGQTDESHGLKDVPCADTGTGICQGTGAYVCNPADPLGPVQCDITNPPGVPTTEICNNLDDNCNGVIDEGAENGSIQSWVNIGGNIQMFAYEATRPDATQTAQGVLEDYVCSRPGGLPWTNVTRPAAEAICSSIGARLCTEYEWQRACQGLPAATTPVQQGAGPEYIAFVEAENFVQNVSAGPPTYPVHYWVMDTNPGYSGSAAVRAVPNVDTLVGSASVASSPRLEYQVNFTQTGTHYVWIRGLAANQSDEAVFVGIDAATPQIVELPSNIWVWEGDQDSGSRATVNVTTAGVHTIKVWMREDGVRMDALLITKVSTFTPNQSDPNGCEWSFGASCTTYSAATCNGLEYDSRAGTPGDQNDMTYGGQLASCYTDWQAAGKLYDLSGNVKEWTAPRSPGVNPVRGGSYTSGGSGLACDYSFTVADDEFFFPNVGFRCCRAAP